MVENDDNYASCLLYKNKLEKKKEKKTEKKSFLSPGYKFLKKIITKHFYMAAPSFGFIYIYFLFELIFEITNWLTTEGET